MCPENWKYDRTHIKFWRTVPLKYAKCLTTAIFSEQYRRNLQQIRIGLGKIAFSEQKSVHKRDGYLPKDVVLGV